MLRTLFVARALHGLGAYPEGNTQRVKAHLCAFIPPRGKVAFEGCPLLIGSTRVPGVRTPLPPPSEQRIGSLHATDAAKISSGHFLDKTETLLLSVVCGSGYRNSRVQAAPLQIDTLDTRIEPSSVSSHKPQDHEQAMSIEQARSMTKNKPWEDHSSAWR